VSEVRKDQPEMLDPRDQPAPPGRWAHREILVLLGGLDRKDRLARRGPRGHSARPDRSGRGVLCGEGNGTRKPATRVTMRSRTLGPLGSPSLTTLERSLPNPREDGDCWPRRETRALRVTLARQVLQVRRARPVQPDR
jgi:hypothetical protein